MNSSALYLRVWGFTFIALAAMFATIGETDASLAMTIIASVHFVGAYICDDIKDAQKGKL